MSRPFRLTLGAVPKRKASVISDKKPESSPLVAVSEVSTQVEKASKSKKATKRKKPSKPPQPRANQSMEHGVLVSLLTELRESVPISQRALSLKLGKTHSHWGIVESRGRDLTFVEVARFCEVVGVSFEELVARYVAEVANKREVHIPSGRKS